jgi:hypothetical protein
MNRKTRAGWCRALDPADLSFLAAYHHVCLKTRLESRRS